MFVRADGVEGWGLRGELWALRWQDATQLHYRAKRVHAVGLDAMLLLKLFPSLGRSITVAFVDVNGRRRKLPSSLQGMDVFAERVVEHHTAAHFPELRSALDARSRFAREGRLSRSPRSQSATSPMHSSS
ncbi:MAG TPA: hypothetical protein VG496_15780 [Myxococcales bacterium]|nr:hypothetical protein [Myxococcales bacterium]